MPQNFNVCLTNVEINISLVYLENLAYRSYLDFSNTATQYLRVKNKDIFADSSGLISYDLGLECCLNEECIVQTRTVELPDNFNENSQEDINNIKYGEWKAFLEKQSFTKTLLCLAQLGLLTEPEMKVFDILFDSFEEKNCFRYCVYLSMVMAELNIPSGSISDVPCEVEKEQSKSHGYIYVLSDDGYAIKVGYSKNPLQRLNQLISQSGRNLQLLGYKKGTLQEEKQFHSRNQNTSLVSEWYPFEMLGSYMRQLGIKPNFSKDTLLGTNDPKTRDRNRKRLAKAIR